MNNPGNDNPTHSPITNHLDDTLAMVRSLLVTASHNTLRYLEKIHICIFRSIYLTYSLARNECACSTFTQTTTSMPIIPSGRAFRRNSSSCPKQGSHDRSYQARGCEEATGAVKISVVKPQRVQLQHPCAHSCERSTEAISNAL